MKKLIKFTLHYAYSILAFVFLIYLLTYTLCELDIFAPVYTYILVLLLGMIIGFGLYRQVTILLNRMDKN